MKKEKEIIEFNQDYFDEIYENGITIDDALNNDWNKVFKKYEMMLVVGSSGTWQGQRYIAPTIIYETNISSFLELLSKDIETQTFKFHYNKIEYTGSHHDGTNYYTIIPFKWDMLTHPAITKIIKDLDLYVDLGHFVRDKISITLRAYDCKKEHKIQFLEELHIDNLTEITEDYFAKKYEIKL